MNKYLPLILLASAFAGCTHYLPSVGPDYEEPKFAIDSYDLPDAGAVVTNENRVVISDNVLNLWWKRFDDPILVDLVEGAVTNNLNYKIAVRRLEQANWELRGTYSAFLPKFGVAADMQWGETRPNNSGLERRHAYEAPSLGVGLDWEIDIFGGSRRKTESALALAEAAHWTVADAWLALTTSIGKEYINLRSTQARIRVARTNLKLQSETYSILASRLKSGIGDELAVNQCAYILEQTRARIPALLELEESQKNAIAILAGQVPGSLHEILKPVEDDRMWLLAPQKVTDLPYDMMRSRPDVKVAERQLAAQVARIGVAKAMWFPKLYITGSIGVQSDSVRSFFAPESIIGSFGPSVNWAIFQAGAVYSSVKAEEAKTEAAVLNYNLAIENAYAEVRNCYAAYTQEYHRYKALKDAAKAANDALTISSNLYRNGLRDFNNVIDAQRSLVQCQEDAEISCGQVTIKLINLYRALGGGLQATELN